MSVIDWLHSIVNHSQPKPKQPNLLNDPNVYKASSGQAPNPSPYATYTPSGQGAATISEPTSVLGNYTYGSGGTNGSGTGTAIDPQKQSLIGDLQSKWSTLQNVYNNLFGQVDNYAKDATGKLQSTYDTQQNQDINNFNKTQGLTSSMYAARGLGDSSYLGDAQGQNADTFNQALSDQAVNRDNQLAQIGQQVSGQKAQLTAQRDAYAPYIQNLSQYGVGDLQGLQGNLQSAIGNANTTAAGLGTSSDFIGKLNAITPLESQASSQLAAKLKNLTLSSAPASAKKYIAQGLIKSSTLNDANASGYWTDYFNNLLNGQPV